MILKTCKSLLPHDNINLISSSTSIMFIFSKTVRELKLQLLPVYNKLLHNQIILVVGLIDNYNLHIKFCVFPLKEI